METSSFAHSESEAWLRASGRASREADRTSGCRFGPALMAAADLEAEIEPGQGILQRAV